MKAKNRLCAILLRREQMEDLKRIQERQRQQSLIGVAPSVHEIARGLMTKALNEVKNG